MKNEPKTSMLLEDGRWISPALTVYQINYLKSRKTIWGMIKWKLFSFSPFYRTYIKKEIDELKERKKGK